MVPSYTHDRIPAPEVTVTAETAAGFYGLAGLLAGVPTRLAHYRSMHSPRSLLPALKSWIYQLLTNLFCQRIIGVSTSAPAMKE